MTRTGLLGFLVGLTPLGISLFLDTGSISGEVNLALRIKLIDCCLMLCELIYVYIYTNYEAKRY